MDTEPLRSLPRGTFATFVRDLTPTGLALNVPYADLSALAQMTAAEQQAIRARMREQFSFTPQSKWSPAGTGARSQADDTKADPAEPRPAPQPCDPQAGDHTKPAVNWGDG
jgi:hypothetical protein